MRRYRVWWRKEVRGEGDGGGARQSGCSQPGPPVLASIETAGKLPQRGNATSCRDRRRTFFRRSESSSKKCAVTSPSGEAVGEGEG